MPAALLMLLLLLMTFKGGADSGGPSGPNRPRSAVPAEELLEDELLELLLLEDEELPAELLTTLPPNG